MRPWTHWMYGLGLSGALAFGLIGCGGGDVPDPGSDELAADEGDEFADEAAIPQPPPIQAPPGGGEIAPAPAPDAPAPAPDAGPATAAAPAAADAPASPPAAEAAGATSSSSTPDAPAGPKSETAELLAAATAAAAPESSIPAPAATAAGAGGNPFAPAGPGSAGVEPDAGQLAYPGAANSSAMNGPGSAGELGPGGPTGADGSSAAMGPDGGGPGGASQLKEGDSRSPRGAVQAFLYALEHKDRDRLAEATALRANTLEEGGKHRELFSRIIDTSISDAELDDLAEALDGYRDTGENKAHSTGRLGVTIRKKKDKGGWLQRTVTVRHEKKGWGVLDISDTLEFNQPVRGRNMRRR